MNRLRKSGGVVAMAVALSWYYGCRTDARTVPPPSPASLPATAAVETPALPAKAPAGETLARMGYTIQVGAFAVLDNARALAEALTAAVVEAGKLKEKGRILEYFIVAPQTML